MNTKDFANKYNIKLVSEPADSNPHFVDDKTPMNHYKIRLMHNKKQMTLFFSMGLGLTGEPTAEDVLDCLASDAAGVENARSFEDWCSEYGYDTDSRKAEHTFKICTKQAKQLENLLGEELYKELLWETERL